VRIALSKLRSAIFVVILHNVKAMTEGITWVSA
jgi:hypothetical protein